MASQDEASTSDDSQSDEEGKSRKKNLETIKIGSIKIKSKEEDSASEKTKTKRIVFNVKSLRALQSNMGVFSV
jgi:hypothetical protein